MNAPVHYDAALEAATLDAWSLPLSEIDVSDFPAVNPASKRIGYLSVRAIDLYTQYFQDAGRTTDRVPGATLVTNAFIPFANDFDRRPIIAQAKAAR